MKFKVIVLFICFFSFNLSFSQRISTFVIGEIAFNLPGKWKVVGSIKSSGQYHVANEKGKIGLLISARDASKFEFYNDTLSPIQLVEHFYNWEKEYWIAPNTDHEVIARTLKINNSKNYIIWELTVKKLKENNDQDLKSRMLYTLKNNRLVSISLADGPKAKALSDEEIIKLFEGIFNDLKNISEFKK
ncbi:hypothetical protein AMR72_12245 [Flavobacterium psychrophilum]|nr:hypothetical protein AMR72_12245 [Flavobacterium psychrophilum]AOE53221.1 hypothetical protein ALW18_12235 [Flavobacterium psychrophilum]